MERGAGIAWVCAYFFICILLIAGVQFDQANAQSIERVEISSSMNPVGSGARAMGMGGAFVGVADDATAASWNPGGLIQLETPEMSIVGAHFQRNEDNTFDSNPEASGQQEVSKSTLNYLSAAYPFSLFDRNMIVSLNYQNLYDFARDWNYSLKNETENLQVEQQVDYEQEGVLSAWGFAYAIQVMPQLSCGVTLNFWEDGLYSNGWEQTAIQTASGSHSGEPFQGYIKSKEEYKFSGINFNLGILWRISSQLSLGAVFKSPFTADLKYSSSDSYEINFPDSPLDNTVESSSLDEDEKLDMPMSYGFGLAYRFSDKFSASADIYRTEWDDYVHTDYNGDKTSPISGKPIEDSDISPTTQVRVGMEYLFLPNRLIVPLRGGVFYDPMPSEGSPDDFFGFSLGTGIGKGRFIFDFAYQYRFGNDVGTSIVDDYEFSQDVREHTVYVSMIIHL